jgi:hypothetical protein
VLDTTAGRKLTCEMIANVTEHCVVITGKRPDVQRKHEVFGSAGGMEAVQDEGGPKHAAGSLIDFLILLPKLVQNLGIVQACLRYATSDLAE